MAETNENESETMSMINIPDELVVANILPRMPVKSLLRFKSVSKSWNNVISSSEFTKIRLEFGYSSPQFLIPSYQQGDDCRIISISYSECCNTLEKPVELQSQHHIDNGYQTTWTIVDSCRGLVCLNLDNEGSFGIWNPNTDQYQQISQCQESPDNNYRDSDMIFQAEGFGYTSSTDDYKIFGMYSKPFFPEKSLYYLFSFKSGRWKLIKVSPETNFAQTVDSYTGVCVEERLYWPRNDIQSGTIVGLFCLDLATEEMTELEVSDEFVECEYDRVTHIFAVDGKLSINCCNYTDEVNHVWILKEENDSKSWIKLFSFDKTDISVLGFTTTGRYLALHQNQFKLIDPQIEGSYRSRAGIDYNYGHLVTDRAWHYVPSTSTFRINEYDHVLNKNGGKEDSISILGFVTVTRPLSSYEFKVPVLTDNVYQSFFTGKVLPKGKFRRKSIDTKPIYIDEDTSIATLRSIAREIVAPPIP